MTTGIVLVAHGSPVPAANEELHGLVSLVRERGGYAFVEPAFLEGARPDISEGIGACVAQGAQVVVVIPYFLLLGKHVAHDLPEWVRRSGQQYTDVEIVLGQHLAAHPLLGEILLERVNATGFFGTIEGQWEIEEEGD